MRSRKNDLKLFCRPWASKVTKSLISVSGHVTDELSAHFCGSFFLVSPMYFLVRFLGRRKMIALRIEIIRIFQRFSDVVHASCRHDPAIVVICIQIDVVVLVQYFLSQLSPPLRVILASDSVRSVAGIPYLLSALDALRSLLDALTTSWTSFIYRHIIPSSYVMRRSCRHLSRQPAAA